MITIIIILAIAIKGTNKMLPLLYQDQVTSSLIYFFILIFILIFIPILILIFILSFNLIFILILFMINNIFLQSPSFKFIFFFHSSFHFKLLYFSLISLFSPFRLTLPCLIFLSFSLKSQNFLHHHTY